MRRRIPSKPRAVSKTKTCNGKRRFHDKAEAVHALHLLTSKSTRDHVPHRAYECGRCKGWHLTSAPLR